MTVAQQAGSASNRTIDRVAQPSCACDSDGTVREANVALGELLGCPADRLIDRPLVELFVIEQRQAVSEQLRSTLTAPGVSHDWLGTLLGGDGNENEEIGVHIKARAWQDGRGIGLSFSDVSIDHNLRAILDNAAIGIMFSRARTIQSCNPRAGEIFGYTPEELIGKPGITLYPNEESYRRVGEKAAPQLSAGQAFQDELPMCRRDGSEVWCRIYAKAVDARHTDAGTIWIFDDISAQRRDEKILRETLLELYAIMSNAPVAIGFSRDRRIVRYNPRFGEMFGYEGSAGVGRPTLELYPSQEAFDAIGVRAFPLLSSGRPFQAEMEMRRQNDSTFWANAIAYLIDPAQPHLGTIWIIEDISEQRRDQELLRLTLMEMEALMANASVGILLTRDRHIVRYNRRFAEMFAFDGDEGIGLSGASLYPTPETYARIGAAATPLLSQARPFQTEVEMRRHDGSGFWAQLIGYVIDPDDTAHGTVWIIEDRSEHKRTETALRNALLENEAILENALIGIAIAENGRILRCNRKMEEIFGTAPGELDGSRIRDLYSDVADWQVSRQAATANFAAGRVHVAECELARRDGSLFWAYLSGRPFDPDQPRARSVWLVDDISQRKRAEAAVLRARDELELRVQERTAELAAANDKLQGEMADRIQAEQRVHHMAYHDNLTGLPNRALLTDRISQALLQARRGLNRVAVMFIDLDRFKHINDSLGHPVGDSLLKAVGARLSMAVRASDTVARQGGDEFVVVLPELQEAEEAALVAKKIIESLNEPFHLHQRDLRISPSIGISLYPDDGGDVDTLLRNADTAMYHAKASGRNNHQFFNTALSQAAAQRFELESLLHHALARGEYRLYFQPIVEIADRRLAAMEVLLRWNQPRLGLVPPDRFIPILEDNGGIVAVGAWVIRQAALQLAAWQAAGLPVVPLAVNLSPRQFLQEDLPGSIGAILAETGIDPALLELEITETGLMQQATRTLEALQAIRALGVRLSIDDFGTGYSSLAYLKRFPVNKLKIDRAFIKDSESSGDDRAIVAAILALAHSLELNVVAEGVETEGQFALLAAKGCRYAQGYLLSKPVPAADAEVFLGPGRPQAKLA